MQVIVRRQDQKLCASITCMIRHYVARRAKVIFDHPHNAAVSAACPPTYRDWLDPFPRGAVSGVRRVTHSIDRWPKQGPASYFPSIEKKYGRSIGEWQQIIAGCGLEKHMAIVGI